MVHEYHVTREELDEWLVDGEKICLAKSRDLGAVPHVRQIFGGLYERCLRYHVAKETDKTGSEIEICHRDIQGMWDEGHARDVLGDWWRAGPKLPHPVWCLDEAKSLQSEEEEGAPSQSGGSFVDRISGVLSESLAALKNAAETVTGSAGTITKNPPDDDSRG